MSNLHLPNFSSKAFLAPMAGVSDPALRLLCKKKGAGLVVTELTSIHSIVEKEKKKLNDFLKFSDEERPLSVQLFGSDLAYLQKAAKIVEPFFDIIDYNMGCPAPHITQQMAGGALLQQSSLTKKIFQTLVEAVEKPVTLKIRAGISSQDHYLFKDIAQIAQDEGIQMITFHPRTVKQGYSGKADWKLIKNLKEMTKIPVVGNGDITTPEDAKQMLEQTGCDYIMIGRGAMGNPFLFEQINDYFNTGKYKQYSLQDKVQGFFDYLDYAVNYNISLSKIKEQAIRFTKGLQGGPKLRKQITLTKNLDELKHIMKNTVDSSSNPSKTSKVQKHQ